MRTLGIFLLICLSVATGFAATPDGIMPISEIKEGMIGVGRTVLKGNQQEEFQVEILGVLHNYLPQQNLILAQCKGANLEETGIIAGMSGSPVYINGKMIGAVAYSWPFAKTPIAGITPIESMLETEVMPQQIPPVVPPVEVANYYDFENLLANHLASPAPVSAALSQIGRVELQPIAAPFVGFGL